MEHELLALRTQIREKSVLSLKIQKEVLWAFCYTYATSINIVLYKSK